MRCSEAKGGRAVATIVVGAALLAGGCHTDREITEPEPVPVTEERLTDALLTEDDVPAPTSLAEDADPIGPSSSPSTSATTGSRTSTPRRPPAPTSPGRSTTLTNTIA